MLILLCVVFLFALVYSLVVVYLTCGWTKCIENSAGRILESASVLYGTIRDVKPYLETIAAHIQSNRAAIDALSDQLKNSGEALSDLRPHLAAIPQLIEALVKIANTQVDLMTDRQAAPQKHPFGNQNSVLHERDPFAASIQHEAEQMMRSELISREEAMSRLNSANFDSVWGQVFQQWGKK
jgi:hypothetical protein